MNNNEKPCKAIGKAIGHYEGCGKMTLNRKYGLCMNCYPDFLYSTDAGKIIVEKATLKASAPRLKMEAQFRKAKEDYEKSKNLSYYLGRANKKCHEYVRLRDENKPCVSCGTPWRDNFHAGHFHKSELFSLTRFNEFNINGQCPSCNIHREGNIENYAVRLPLRIGKDKFKEINDLAAMSKKMNHKWDRGELKEIISYYITKIKNLKNI